MMMMVVVVVGVVVVVLVCALAHRVLDALETVLASLNALVDLGRAAAGAAGEFEGVREDAQEALEILLGRLGAAGERDDESAGAVVGGREDDAGDRAREGGKWGDGEGRGEHGHDEAWCWTVDQGGECLLRAEDCQLGSPGQESAGRAHLGRSISRAKPSPARRQDEVDALGDPCLHRFDELCALVGDDLGGLDGVGVGREQRAEGGERLVARRRRGRRVRDAQEADADWWAKSQLGSLAS